MQHHWGLGQTVLYFCADQTRTLVAMKNIRANTVFTIKKSDVDYDLDDSVQKL